MIHTMLHAMQRRKSSKRATTALPLGDSSNENSTTTNNNLTQFQKITMRYRTPPSKVDLRAKHTRNVITVLTAVLTLCFLSVVGLQTFILDGVVDNDDSNNNSGIVNMKKIVKVKDDEDQVYHTSLKLQKQHMIEAIAKNKVEDLALKRFPQLSSILEHSELVGLYFAASWCPMSTPVTSLLSETFKANMLSMNQKGVASSEDSEQMAQFEIVYVSSDEVVEQMEQYIKPEFNWRTIPFETDERTELKRYFQTCAASEKTALSVDRQHEIPNLIIIDGRSHAIISTNAIKEVEMFGVEAFVQWQQTMMIIRGMESKHLDTM